MSHSLILLIMISSYIIEKGGRQKRMRCGAVFNKGLKSGNNVVFMCTIEKLHGLCNLCILGFIARYRTHL